MKFRALLLSLFVLLLSVKPMVEQVFSQTEIDSCCKAKENHSQPEPAHSENTGCDDLCSPFQPCCPYITFANTSLVLTLPKTFPLTTKVNWTYRMSFTTGHALDFWQPPKNV